MENNIFNENVCQSLIDIIRDINAKISSVVEQQAPTQNNGNESIQDIAENLDYKYDTARRFFTGRINSPSAILQEQEYMRIFAAAFALAAKLQQQNPAMTILPAPMQEVWQTIDQEPETLPVSLASTTQDSLVKAKVAIQEESGRITSEQAWEAKVERNVARVGAVTSTLLDKGVDWIIKNGTRIVEKVFPPASLVTPLVRTAAPWLKDKGEKVINAGLNAVGKYLKNNAPVIKEVAKETWNKIKKASKVASKTIGKLLSWL